ncbi:hypothetical protein CPB84DRAFT_1797403 [Gymnopilus junonius]|uniref:Uncharacterized protein n=1 Tax=Gymnopilus junonius TaxID=109634 RepID=A0A9P5N9N3_GYMJU|nr:hypothetical protein CPB84DRAFT_1797403 [Gymnopilus junonius]
MVLISSSSSPPKYSRTLGEAWFMSSRVVTPRCFGSSLAMKECLDAKGSFRFRSHLPDDSPDVKKYFEDEAGWKSG